MQHALHGRSTVVIIDDMKEVIVLLQVMRFPVNDVCVPCIPVFEHNQGAVQLALNPITNSNCKHVDVRHHFLRKLIMRERVSALHEPYHLQHADLLTKSISREAFGFHHSLAILRKPCDEPVVVVVSLEMQNVCHGDWF